MLYVYTNIYTNARRLFQREGPSEPLGISGMRAARFRCRPRRWAARSGPSFCKLVNSQTKARDAQRDRSIKKPDRPSTIYLDPACRAYINGAGGPLPDASASGPIKKPDRLTADNIHARMVRAVGIEPTHLAVPDFESGASTSKHLIYIHYYCEECAVCKPCERLKRFLFHLLREFALESKPRWMDLP